MRHTTTAILTACMMLLSCVFTAAQTQADWIIQVAIDNPAPYIGEPISYTVQIRYPENAEPLLSTEPIFEGFGRTTFRPEVTTTVDTTTGSTYLISTQVISLIPLRAGSFTIVPYQVITASTPFAESQTIESESIQVTVLPLPQGAPVEFTNAVGQFSIESSVSANSIRIGEAFELSVFISGTGNLEQITTPSTQLPASWISNFSAENVIYENQRYGTREFRWIIVPTDNAAQSIPEVVFAYFNPQIDAYEIRRTVPIALSLQPASDLSDQASTWSNPTITAIPLQQIPASQQSNFLAWLPFGLMAGAPLLSLLTIALRRQNKQQTRKQAHSRTSIKSIYGALDALKNHETNQGYTELEVILLEYLRTRTGRSWTTEQFQHSGRLVHADLWKQLAPILIETSNARYAPASRQDFLRQLELVRTTIRTLERQ